MLKTPEEIARDTLGADALAGVGYEKYLPYLIRAINDDRAQRDPNDDGTLHGAAILALNERADNADSAEGYDDSGTANRAAQWIEDNPDEFWATYAGPMLDDIETEQGRG